MSDLVFYTNPMSRGRIVRWMLEEVGTPYETVVIDYGRMADADYRAVNPMAKVPTLRHGETTVTECAAICCYLAEAFPDAGLSPAPGTAERGAFLRWMFFGAGPVEAAVTNTSFGWAARTPQEEGRLGYGSTARVLDTLEALVAAGPYLMGERFSAADVYLGSQIAWGLQFGTMEARPGFQDYVARIMSRPAARAASAKDDALMPAKA
ncbi:glutathione S-transferase family protein [Histidinibacterium lentulum]|uniref:Glutathione S-transferase family protein n=1 Tax=Histidinibacterium lentulum TaxID=2480588 RepID=A0A3N2R861_9RHOB|nr:glutathione S-transferase family protein [Histidinibacterium lentulum]ROU03659.1 glutathione S-transferase family protein [Histidinibacterium lentulum]